MGRYVSLNPLSLLRQSSLSQAGEAIASGIRAKRQSEREDAKALQDQANAIALLKLKAQMENSQSKINLRNDIIKEREKAKIEQADPYKQAMIQALTGKSADEMELERLKQAGMIDQIREKASLEQQDPYKKSMAGLVSSMAPQGSILGQNSGMRPKVTLGATGPSITFEESPEEKLKQAEATKRMQEIVAGPAEGAVGKVALARESLKNIDDIKRILFPTGKADSFDRGAAFQGNVTGGSLPLIPSFIPTKKGQDLNRKLGASLSGRQLIQTGVAARPEETVRLIGQFAPNVMSDPESSMAGLDELKTFYNDYLKTADPSLRLGGNVLGQQTQGQGQTEEVPQFKTEAEAIAANLPDGTIVMINGKRFKWQAE